MGTKTRASLIDIVFAEWFLWLRLFFDWLIIPQIASLLSAQSTIRKMTRELHTVLPNRQRS